MQIFLSYASEDRKLAEQIYLALIGGEHKVFLLKEISQLVAIITIKFAERLSTVRFLCS